MEGLTRRDITTYWRRGRVYLFGNRRRSSCRL
uniref:Uncharacterized protein n=1 Tax=Rhizophora mucronata TaxID=61149 RepID=A0A2P2M1P0_RHIMU